MAQALAHRGPDAEGFFQKNGLGLAHRRLSIIDLSEKANQPMTSADGRWVVIFNGELFNFREVAAELHLPLRTSSDTEVLAESLAVEGIDAIHRFNGMFAIAAYDTVNDKLFLIRDRMGVKPLFYCQTSEGFFFASEIKALLRPDPVRRTLSLDPVALSFYLRLGYVPEPYTIWKSVRKFPAGHYLQLHAGQSQWTPYWKLGDQIQPATDSSEPELLDRLDCLLLNAVQLRLISDVPFGILLSGGIDSSLIAAMAQKQAAQPINTFTIGFETASHNEAHHAQQIAAYLGTHHHDEFLTEKQTLSLLPEALVLFDEPFADSSALPMLLVARMARRSVKMVLSGDGGDELFMGYGMYRWIHRLQQPLLRPLHRPLRRLLPLLGDRYRRAARLFEPTSHLHEHVFSQEQYFFSEYEAARLLGNRYCDHHLPIPEVSARKLTSAEQQALWDLQFYLRDDLLVKVDRTTMSVGLECRTPFLDYRLVAFALNLPQSLKMKNGELKILPRKLLRRYLPEKLFSRPKQGFSVPMARWLQGSLNAFMEEMLSETAIKQVGLVNYQYVQKLKRNFYSGHRHLYQRLWNLMVLHHWAKGHLRPE